MTLYLRDDLAAAWKGLDPWREIAGLQGEIYRDVKERRTLRFELNGRAYFVKHHTGAGWHEVIKNLLQGRLPILDASNEWRALRRLQALGVSTLQIAGYGVRGGNPARRESFIITDALDNTESLESVCARWPQQPPDPVFKRRLIETVAHISRTLHRQGLCHRDYYLCHFLLHLDDRGRIDQQKQPRLSLIDLHRALIKPSLGQRWVEKDIAGLYFSARGAGLTRRDLLRFTRTYTDRSLRRAVHGQQGFWRAVRRKAAAIAAREQRKQHRALYRSSEHQLCERSSSHYLVLKRASEGEDMWRFLRDPDRAMANGVMLKDGDSTTVMQLRLDNRDYVVKRYNIMGFLHGLRRLPRPSRAWRCWASAHALLRCGIRTAEPVALLERRCGALRRQAWYVTGYVSGEDVSQALAGSEVESRQWRQSLMQFHQLFSIMRREQLVHGDMKATNFLLTDQGLVVLDLDAARRVDDAAMFRRRFKRDLARFLKNWENNPQQLGDAIAMTNEFTDDR